MNIILIKPKSNIQYDITNACAAYRWKGSASQAGRSFEFDYLNSPYESSLKLPTVEVGDFVSFISDTESIGEVFYGQILGIKKSSQIGTITFTANDMMYNLLNSTGKYVFENMTAEAIAARALGDIQIPIRYLYPTGAAIKSMVCDDMSYHDIIMAAYTKAHKITGDKYFPMIYKRGFGIYKSEWIVTGFVLSDESNIYSSDITESMTDISNRVLIYNEKGMQTGEVKDESSISSYGVYQTIYKEEKGINPGDAAKALLRVSPEQKINISSAGDINCLSCYFVKVTDKATGLSGRYWISSDTQTWQNGIYTMELELVFDVLMTEAEAEEKK